MPEMKARACGWEINHGFPCGNRSPAVSTATSSSQEMHSLEADSRARTGIRIKSQTQVPHTIWVTKIWTARSNASPIPWIVKRKYYTWHVAHWHTGFLADKICSRLEESNYSVGLEPKDTIIVLVRPATQTVHRRESTGNAIMRAAVNVTTRGGTWEPCLPLPLPKSTVYSYHVQGSLLFGFLGECDDWWRLSHLPMLEFCGIMGT